MTRFRVVASFLLAVCLDEEFVAEAVRRVDPTHIPDELCEVCGNNRWWHEIGWRRHAFVSADSIHDDGNFPEHADANAEFGGGD